MFIYPYTSPIILTDNLFVEYGGTTGSSTASRRQIAYTIAEETVSEDDLGTFLLPTIITGTYDRVQFFHPDKPLLTDHAYVHRIIRIRFRDEEETFFYTIDGTANNYASLRNKEYGIVDIYQLFGNCQCLTWGKLPYQIEMVYEAGLPTGTANHPNILLALVTYADIVLNEIIGWGNEAPGLVGVQQFRNQEYSEVRTKLKQTAFGSSARAQFVSDLLTKYRKHRYVKL